jgi:hypothetical protein
MKLLIVGSVINSLLSSQPSARKKEFWSCTLRSLEVWPTTNEAVMPMPDLRTISYTVITPTQPHHSPNSIVHGMLGDLRF